MTTGSRIEGPPKKILLATDLSARCDRALDRAVSLAAQWKAQLVAVHALEDVHAHGPGETDALPSWRRPPDPQRQAERQLRSDIGEVAPDITVVVEATDPAELIMRTAHAQGCDLIVTGVARNELLGRLSLGNTVDRLLRRSHVPILVVKNRGRRPYSHVAVATDFSDSSRHALEAAIRLFPRHVLTIFHAYDAPMSGLVTDAQSYRKEYRKVVAQECDAFLKATDMSVWQGQGPEILLEYGAPDRLLYDYVRDKDVDLVVLGTHGRSAFFEAVIGSVAKGLMAILPCDALIVREPRAATEG